MATVTGVTSARAKSIEDRLVSSASRQGTSLVLNTIGGQVINVPNAFPALFESYPVGSIYLSIDNRNPALYMGGGEWSRWGQGRVPISVNEANSRFDAAEEFGGTETVTLTGAQSGMPAHNHVQNAHDHGIVNAGDGGQAVVGSNGTIIEHDPSANPNVNIYVPTGSIYQADVQAATATNQTAPAQNASQAHDNMPPFIAVYMWKRTG